MISRSSDSGAASGIGGQHQVVVDLVGDQQEVVRGAEVGDSAQLGPVPDPAAGVVRRAEQQDALAPGQRRRERVQVHDVPPVALDERRLEDRPAVGPQHPVERVVDRREHDHGVVGLGEGLQAERDSGDQPVGGGDGGRVHLPAVAPRHPAGDRRVVFAVVAEVAVDPVRHRRRQGGVHRRRRAEVHVGDPHRQRVVRREAVARLHPVPLHRVGAAAVDQLVEVEHLALVGMARRGRGAPTD
jgi:hypothetical protein